MTPELSILLATAAAVGVIHTLVGPDHYLPFIVLARARRWSLARTAWITLACGFGHVLGSVVLGLVGIGLGVAVSRLEAVESARGDLAAWLLITLGLLYFAWGLRRARRGHAHLHLPGSHAHPHPHGGSPGGAGHADFTPWALFLVFVLGPCEPLIPLLMVPAATTGLADAALVAAVFGAATLATMVGVVALGTFGVNLLPVGRLERYSHALAGAAIFISGLGVRLLGS